MGWSLIWRIPTECVSRIPIERVSNCVRSRHINNEAAWVRLGVLVTKRNYFKTRHTYKFWKYLYMKDELAILFIFAHSGLQIWYFVLFTSTGLKALCLAKMAARLLRLWVRIPPGAWIFVCCECRVLSGRGLCDELITRPEESYRMCCVVVCDLETSRIGAPYIYDISNLRVNLSTMGMT